MTNEYEIGVVGLGAMGRNLLLNITDHGYRAIGFTREKEKVQSIQELRKRKDNIQATQDIKIFIQELRKPRAIILLVPAGEAVDAVIKELSPLLATGDLIIDAGNSHFKDTDLRKKSLQDKGVSFFGMGVSGGEAGARNGPSIMPGGDQDSYERVRPILESIAAKVNNEPCVAYLGSGSAGHYVKMVHNGIEYGLMQLIAETYCLLKTVLKLSDDECHGIYNEWNKSELGSYLLEITAQIFLKNDDQTGQRLIDVVLDVAKQKGTGNWMCQDAMDLQVPVPTIDAAVAARDLSTYAADRKKANETLLGPHVKDSVDQKLFLQQLRNAFYASSILTFVQSMVLLQKASTKYHYNLNLETVTRIWRGGCIIRAALLEPILSAFHKSNNLSNLLFDPVLGKELATRQADLRSIVQLSAGFGLSVPAMMASLSYFDGFRTARSPANLIQAQRDFFGAHGFERKDQAGSYHSDWGNP